MSTLDITAAVIPDGCSCFTKATFQDLTPGLYENQGVLAVGANKIYANAKRARMVGVQPTILNSFLLGAVKDVKTPVQKIAVSSDKFVNLPYTVRFRTANISNEYFQVTDGATAGGTAGLWNLTVEVIADSLFDAPAGQPISNQFLKGQYIYIQHADKTLSVGAQTSLKTAYLVVSSTEVSDTVATVQVLPSMTAVGFAALVTQLERDNLQPTEGVVTIGLNNVDDYEQSCIAESVELAPQHIIDFHQTSRSAFCYTDEFLLMDKAIAAGDINDYYSTFRHLPVTEQNRIREKKFQDKFAQAVFFNGPINELQSPEAYMVNATDASLTVIDPGRDDNCILGYKANALGIRQLLALEGQVLDMQGGELNLNTLFDACYSLKRNREIDGQTVDTIGSMTSRKVYDRVVSTLIQYIKSTYGIDNLNMYMEKGEILDHMTSVAMKYMKFDLPEFDFAFVIASDNFFTDNERLAIASGMGTHAGQMWLIDWSDLTVGIVDTNSQKIDENDLISAKVVDAMKCTMEQNTIHRTLESTTWTVMFGSEKRSLLVEGFNPDRCITLTSSTCTNLAGAPTTPVATGGDTEASVAFVAPVDNGGAAISSYTVTSSPGGITKTGAASPIVVTDLTNATEYTFTVVATNVNGSGAPSVASNAVTPA
jgi:hypothetical protein